MGDFLNLCFCSDVIQILFFVILNQILYFFLNFCALICLQIIGTSRDNLWALFSSEAENMSFKKMWHLLMWAIFGFGSCFSPKSVLEMNHFVMILSEVPGILKFLMERVVKMFWYWNLTILWESCENIRP